METRIENGVTIIMTGYKGNQPKHGYTGISYNPKSKTYRAVHYYKRKKYSLGTSMDREELIARKKEAEKRATTGDFLQWYRKLEI